MKNVRVTVTGAGPAGLSLAALLAAHGDITLVSDSLEPKDDKTWCFWDSEAAPHPNLIHHKWNRLRVITRTNEHITSSSGEASYYCVRSAAYQRYMLQQLEQQPSVTMLKARISSFSREHDGVVVKTDKGTIHSDLLFQSHQQPEESITYSQDRISLKQHFLGWDITCKKPIFNPDEAILMDFRVSQEYGFAFVYVLPFSQTNALIEVTYFTENLLPDKTHYETQIRTYLLSQWGLTNESYHVDREEFGIIPMADGFVSALNEHPIYSIGLAGGHAKASTGYAFARIHRDAARIAKAISEGNRPGRASLSAMRFRFYDLLMLNIIKTRPDHAVMVFEELFRKNGFQAMFNFLDEKTTLAEEIKIMASVPSYIAFFTSMAQTRKRYSDIIHSK